MGHDLLQFHTLERTAKWTQEDMGSQGKSLCSEHTVETESNLHDGPVEVPLRQDACEFMLDEAFVISG